MLQNKIQVARERASKTLELPRALDPDRNGPRASRS